MRISDVCLAFPGSGVCIGNRGLLGGGLDNAVFALAVIHAGQSMPDSRSKTLAQQNTNYIAAAQLAGNHSLAILVKHILPNCMASRFWSLGCWILAQCSWNWQVCPFGMGAQPPTAELG